MTIYGKGCISNYRNCSLSYVWYSVLYRMLTPFHHSQVERNDMGSFTSFDYTLIVTDELVDEILALGDKVEITFPEKLRMKLLQKIGRIKNRYII